MTYFVYIIFSLKDQSYYKGFSENPFQRLVQHNNKESTYTAAKTPWKLVFFQSYLLKSDAIKREKVLKKYSHSQILQLIQSSLNELKT